METTAKIIDIFSKHKSQELYKIKKELLTYLKELKHLEAKLWGISIKEIFNFQEEILEDTNHLIYLISKKNISQVKKILSLKSSKQLKKDLQILKKDFKTLRDKIKKQNTLKNLISQFTIKLVTTENYQDLEEIFILEKQLYEEIEFQESELNKLFSQINFVNILDSEKSINELILTLKRIREIFSSSHQRFKNMNQLYPASNINHILYKLIKIVLKVE